MNRVLLVEDHASFRQAMALVFKGEPDFGPVREAASMSQARRKRASSFDLVVIDLGLPDGDGTKLIRTLKEPSPSPTVLVLTANLDREQYALAIEAGADGVLHKAAEIEEILASARSLLSGEPILTPEETVAFLRLAIKKRAREGKARVAAQSLTRREREVLQCLADGLSKKGDREETPHRRRDRAHAHDEHLREVRRPLAPRSPPLRRPPGSRGDKGRKK